MILKISTNKTRYDKGQIFPFLIALIVVIVIIAMITVNLGQIALFKTDVSNAADAAALAGASTLSGYLLGIGLQSDMLCAKMLVTIAGILIELPIPFPGNLICIIATYIAYIVSMLVTYFQALEGGKMAWSNAKKTALQYAFQNAGIDEQRPTFKEFLKGVYGISDPDSLSPEDIARYYRVYSLGDIEGNCVYGGDCDALRRKVRDFTQSGFSRFMEKSGYWDDHAWGEIKPGYMSPGIITSGYGWNREGQNSYKSGDSYKNYQNYVEVRVTANVIYPLEFYNLIGVIMDKIRLSIENNLFEVWWMIPLGIVLWVQTLIIELLMSFFPGGFKMDPIKENTDGNPITVTVRRYKSNNNLGLWNFRYGKVEAEATSHVYRENGNEDIKPLLEGDLWGFVQTIFGGNNGCNCTYGGECQDAAQPGGWCWSWFDTRKHLFETELTNVR